MTFHPGKAHCGAWMTHKRCRHCGSHREVPTGGPCDVCKRPLLPWCEMWTIGGSRCANHQGDGVNPPPTRHPDAPLDFHETIAAESGPRAQEFLQRTKDKPLHEMVAEMARIMASRAIDKEDPRAAESAARSAESAARTGEIARKAELDKPTAAGGMVTIKVTRRELPARPPPAAPPKEDDE